MPFIAIIIGAILIVAAFQGTQGTLATALEQDIPGFFKWAIAIAVILGLGYIPGLRTPTRWLLGLVVLVIVLKNYQNIFNGFKNFAGSGTQTAQQSAQSETTAEQAAAQQATQAQTAMAAIGGGQSASGSINLGSIASTADLASLALA